MATHGSASAATTTHALPLAITGAMTDTRPSSGDPSRSHDATTPVGSGAE